MLILLMPSSTPEFESFMLHLVEGQPYERISNPDDVDKALSNLSDFNHQHRLLFSVQLDSLGLNLTMLNILKKLTVSCPQLLSSSTGFLVVQSVNEWHTKTFASWLMFTLNDLGCGFMGHPLLEMTAGLNNLNRWEQTAKISRQHLIQQLGTKSFHRFLAFQPTRFQREPRLTVLHASHRTTSNTLSLWHLVKQHLTKVQVEEYHVANGTVLDCIGCPYQTCLYYGRQQSCFYGGDIIKELFPAIEKSDGLVWICPNYNDSLSANLMAVINRLTALYRTHSFYEKKIFAVIVSGNSGSDAVARQLIDALCINKGFQLPPSFCLTATAYDPGSLLQVPGIEKRAATFAALMMNEWLSK